MYFERFKSFNLHFLIACLDCYKINQLSLALGKVFNLQGDCYCTHESECNFICDQCNLSIFVDLKKIFRPQVIRDIYDGILLLQKGNQSC